MDLSCPVAGHVCLSVSGASTAATGRCGDLTKWSGSVLDDAGHCHHHAGTRTTEVGGWGAWGGGGGGGAALVMVVVMEVGLA